jgi:mannose-1-phosphate guanylyltransferase
VAETAPWVVILAGGTGSRFWPASRPSRPKQLLPLAGPRPLIAESVTRALTLTTPERLGILAGEPLTGSLRAALPGLSPDAFWIEPEARGTAPVLAWAAWRVAQDDPDGVLVSLHADHAIEPESAFTELVLRAARVAREERVLLTLGIEPDRPETGYGYIRPGAPLQSPDAVRVDAFVEKPDAETARRYVAEGYVWNSGIFVWRASVFLDELRAHTPEIAALLPLLEDGDVGSFFRKAPRISVDEAVLERSGRVGMMRANFRWDDVGSWEALGRTHAPDGSGNVILGKGRVVDGSGNIVYGEDGEVVLFDVDDLVAVRSGGITLVTRRSRAHDLKRLVDHLPPALLDPDA